MPHLRIGAIVASGLAAALAVAACAPIPAPDPGYVTDFKAGDDAPSASRAAQPRGPQWQAPAKDPLAWQDCTDRLSTTFGTAPAGGATLQCATLTVRLGDSGSPLRLALTRARVPGTPDGAAPLVLVGGTEFTGQRAVATLAAADSPLLAGRAVVAVDRRGLGASDALNCRNPAQRAALRSGGTPDPQLADRISAIDTAARSAATSCGDAYPATLTEYTATGAAEDLEALRKAWNVPALGLLAVGDGSSTALAYAAKYPKNIARLVLDSPVRYRATELQRAEDAAQGLSDTVDAVASQCGPGCALGPDPTGAVRSLIDDAAAGRLGSFTDTDLRRAVIMTLGTGPGDRDARIARLAVALQSARSDGAALRALLRTADDALGSDGQFVSRCADAVTKASPDQITASAQKWGPQYRLGAASALDLGTCAAWPTMPELPALTNLEVSTVVATAAANPLSARTALETLTGQLTVVGAKPSPVTWAGIGDGAVLRSACMQKAVAGYLERLDAPSPQACPA